MRDEGQCKICGLPVLYDKRIITSWGATIDHIIPLSKGGKHKTDNCQLAHRICNSLKSDQETFTGIDWEKKSEENNYWRKMYEQGIALITMHANA